MRSWSQKNLASDRRAAITLSLPAMISLAAVLRHDIGDHEIAVGQPAGLGVAQREAFLVVLIEVAITSGGTLRKLSSKLPISTTGHSTRPAVSLEQALVLDQLEALREGEVARFGADDLGPCAPRRR